MMAAGGDEQRVAFRWQIVSARKKYGPTRSARACAASGD
jgi:hypothetical protein